MTSPKRLTSLVLVVLLSLLLTLVTWVRPAGRATSLPRIVSPSRPQAALDVPWEIELVDDNNYDLRLGPRGLALDASGRPRLAYGATHLYYAWNDGGVWRRRIVDAAPGAGGDASLALDASGAPRISYRGAGGSLKYAWATTGMAPPGK